LTLLKNRYSSIIFQPPRHVPLDSEFDINGKPLSGKNRLIGDVGYNDTIMTHGPYTLERKLRRNAEIQSKAPLRPVYFFRSWVFCFRHIHLRRFYIYDIGIIHVILLEERFALAAVCG
jgi:hypothetical protein